MITYPALTVRSEQAGFGRFLTQMIDRLIDSKVSQKTQRLYMKLYEVRQLDGAYLTSYLFSPASFINKSNINSVNHLASRLKIVESLLVDEQQLYTTQLRKLTVENFPSDAVNPAIIRCSEANNFEHRRQAQTTTVAIYNAFGFAKIESITNE